MSKQCFSLLAAAFVLSACSPANDTASEIASTTSVGKPTTSITQAPQQGLQSGILLSGFDQSIAPGDDFYHYVNGTWLATTTIPADKSNYGSFSILVDAAEEHLHSLIESAAAEKSPEGNDSQKIGDFYTSFMDLSHIETLGATPLAATLAQLAAISSKEELLQMTTDLYRVGVQIPTGIYISNDEKQPDHYITYISQSGLGLPNRDWYLTQDNDSHTQARAAYQTYIGKVMALAGYSRAAQTEASVMNIEHQLAQAQWDKVKNRQAELTYNKRSVDDLRSEAPGIDWAALLQGLGIEETIIVVNQPSFLEMLGKIWNAVPLEQWQDYYAFKTVDAFAAYLSDDFVQAQFDFEGRVLGGQEQLKPRWKRGVGVVGDAMGEVLGRLYVQNYFREASKQRMDTLVKNLLGAFQVGIDELDWMTPETKQRAQDKLASFNTKIGYPDKWKDYAALSVEPADLVGNVMRSRRVEHARETGKLGMPVDREEWFMTPYTVNAYYNPPMNEVVFPAAILQPPFFNVDADDAVNYGAIGAVIGHELSHGFDDQGRKYDGTGNLNDWWTEADATAFADRASRLVAQYNKIEVLPGKFLNGEFTLGENIGDLSGLAIAYRAYHMSLEGEEPAVIDGFTGDQRFFIGWAQIWRRLYRDANLEVRLTSDPHSTSEARTNAVVRNFDQWYQAFNIGSEASLYLPPEERVKIW